MSRTRFRDGLTRGAAVALFAVLFFAVWQPARRALAVRAVGPLVGTVSEFPVEVVADPPSVRAPAVRAGSGAGAPTYGIPGGLHFLVPGLLLVAAAPRRPYWLILWGVLLALGAVMLGAFALGLAGVRAGFVVNSLFQNYLVPPVSLGTALLLLDRHRRRTPAVRAVSRIPLTTS